MAGTDTNIPHKWTRSNTRELLDLYLDGMDIGLLSKCFEVTPDEIVVKLSGLLLDRNQPLRDKDAKNFGKPWNWVHDSKLWRMYALRTPIPQMAANLERDELGVCFRLLSEKMVIMPRRIVEEFDLNEEDFALELEKAPSISVCSRCFDVSLFCKCYF